jgi:hypothetical protein
MMGTLIRHLPYFYSIFIINYAYFLIIVLNIKVYKYFTFLLKINMIKFINLSKNK